MTGLASTYDVAVIGGGPAGSVAAWALAKRGVRVVVLERATFPREKVCGDFVEPGGLRILAAMGCLDAIEASSPLAIDHSRIFVRDRTVYRSKVLYYEGHPGLPDHGYIVPRHELDAHLLDAARSASATVLEDCLATDVERKGDLFEIHFRRGEPSSSSALSVRARLLVGADGAQSMVARRFGLLRHDRRYVAVSQRGYVEGVVVDRGEASVFFDDEFFPGYGWMFPMSDGRANIGVGVLSETCQRYRLSVPAAYRAFLDKLRLRHPGCGEIRAVGKPIGGIVKTYTGAGPNYFDGGVLVGDAGCFVDPMTGEGITPAMESALLAAKTLFAALEQGGSDAVSLAQFEQDFRAYFDPAMNYLSFSAALMRNRHFRDFWLSAAERIFLEGTENATFAAIAGSSFGGVSVRPLSILGQAYSAALGYALEGGVDLARQFLGAAPDRERGGWAGDWSKWQRGLRSSFLDDPFWHLAWQAELLNRWTILQRTLWSSANPRAAGAELGLSAIAEDGQTDGEAPEWRDIEHRV